MAGREDSHDGQTGGSRADDRADARQLQAQLGLLEEEISMLRRKLTESPEASICSKSG